MKIVQLTNSFSKGDSISNHAVAVMNVLKSLAYETMIYTENKYLFGEIDYVKTFDPIPKLGNEDILIYHISTGSMIKNKLRMLKCRKIAWYHNITPPEFYIDYNLHQFDECFRGVQDVRELNDVFDYSWADSEFNKNDLVKYGYKCNIDVLPILVPFDDYDKKPNEEVLSIYNDGTVNILFISRLVPNKKFEDVIAAFSCYVKHYDPDASLLIVGSCEGMESYREQLDEFVDRLSLKNVVFTDKVPFDEILAYYKVADVFLCMSEHEGFCVPLVEAMFFDVPIIAYASSAVPETLSGAGILLHEKNPLITAGVINKLVTDSTLRDAVIEGQRKRISDFSYEKTSDLFLKCLESFIGERK